MSSSRLLPKLRRDSAIWLVVAAILFAISAILTSLVTYVERAPPQRGIEISVTGPPEIQRPRFDFHVVGEHLILKIDKIDPRLEVIRFGPFPANAGQVTCADTSFPFSPPNADFPGRSEPSTFGEKEDVQFTPNPPNDEKDANSYAINVFEIDEVQGTPPDGIHVECNLPSAVAKDTFVSRSFEVISLEHTFDSKSTRGSLLGAETVAFSDEDSDAMTATDLGTGETRLGSVIAGRFSGTESGFNHTAIEFRWNSIVASQSRDIVLIVIGSLIALGAAAVIESLRPYIDGLTGDANTRG